MQKNNQQKFARSAKERNKIIALVAVAVVCTGAIVWLLGKHPLSWVLFGLVLLPLYGCAIYRSILWLQSRPQPVPVPPKPLTPFELKAQEEHRKQRLKELYTPCNPMPEYEGPWPPPGRPVSQAEYADRERRYKEECAARQRMDEWRKKQEAKRYGGMRDFSYAMYASEEPLQQKKTHAKTNRKLNTDGWEESQLWSYLNVPYKTATKQELRDAWQRRKSAEAAQYFYFNKY